MAALLQSEGSEAEIEAAIDRVIEREMVRSRPASSDPREIVFRHGLVREAAYASLSPRDAKAAHKRAGLWLEKNGTASPLVLAEHFERGGDPLRAASALLRAATQAIEGNDFALAIERAEKSLALGLTADSIPAAHTIIAEAHRWRGEAEEAWQAARAAIQSAEPHGRAWLRAVGEMAYAAYRTSRLQELVEFTRELDADAPPESSTDPERVAALLMTLGMFARVFSSLTDRSVLDRVLLRTEKELARLGKPPPELLVDIAVSRGTRALADRDYEAALVHAQERHRATLQAGNLRTACEAANSLGFIDLLLGRNEEAEAAFRGGVENARRVGLPREAAQCNANLALVLARTGRLHQGIAVASESLGTFRALGDGPLQASSLLDLADLTLQTGDVTRGEQYAREGLRVADVASPSLAVYGRSLLARVLLARGMSDEAARLAEDAYRRRDAIITRDASDAAVDLAYAQSLRAAGRVSEAREVAAKAMALLDEQAARIRDEGLRRSFLERVPENRAMVSLAEALRGA